MRASLPADCLVGFDRVCDRHELALFLRSLWASLKSIGSQEQERMHRIGLGLAGCHAGGRTSSDGCVRSCPGTPRMSSSRRMSLELR
jgi:hypothetical protein